MADTGVVYFEEIHSDDEGPDHVHNGEEVEQIAAPFELPVHTLTADMVAAHKEKEKEKEKATAESEAIRLRGNAAFGAKRFEEAVKLYDEAITIDGANGSLFGNRAAALLQLGRAQPALADAREMVRLMPQTPKAHFRLGSALSACNQAADAAGALLAALRLDPTNDAVAEALRKEVGRPALSKKGKQQHASLLQECQQALNASKVVRGGEALPTAPPALPSSGRFSSHTKWREMPSKGDVRPPRRGGATLTEAAGRLWLVGGADRTGKVYSDVWEYVPEGYVPDGAAADGGHGGGEGEEPAGWRAHELAGDINMRSGHAATAVQSSQAAGCSSSVFVFGGQDPRSSVLLADLRILDVPSRTGIDATWSPEPLSPLGDTPEARNGHSLSSDVRGGTLLLFGGANGEGHLGDLQQLTLVHLASRSIGRACGSPVDADHVTNRVKREEEGDGKSAEEGGGERGTSASSAAWSSPACTGAPPAAREMHVAAVLPERRQLLIHGGKSGDTDILDDVCLLALDTWVWDKAISSPHRRVGHAAALLPAAAPSVSSSLIILGGFSGKAFGNDASSCELAPSTGKTSGELHWRRLPGGAWPERFAHCAAPLGDRLFIFGGSTPSSELNDLWGL